MNNDIFSTLKGRGVSEILRLRHKIGELEDELKSPRLAIFEDKNVLVAIPNIDKFGNQIREENPSLFFSQWSAAHDLNIYLQKATRATALGVVKQVDDMQKFTYLCDEDFSIDYLVLLYEFTDLERGYIEKEIKRNQLGGVVNKDVQIIRLY